MGDILSDVDVFMARMNKQLTKAGMPNLIIASNMYTPPPLSSGILSLDVCLNGGWAGNRWVEIYGNESSGKTTSILHTISTNQKLNPEFMVFWLASEPYDIDWAETNGVDNSRVTVLETQHMELGLQAVLDAAKANLYDMFVIDSYPALIADQEEGKGMDELVVASGARVMSKFFRKVGGTFSEERPYTGFIVNQFRDKIGVMFGDPRTTPGGKAKNFAFYQRLEVSRDEWIKEKLEGYDGDYFVGQTTKIQVIKNKAGAPKQVAKYNVYFAPSKQGHLPGEIDIAKDIVSVARRYKIITQNGGWFYFGDDKWNGVPAVEDAVRQDLDLQENMYKLVIDSITKTKE
jgi:recombination protein RecA